MNRHLTNTRDNLGELATLAAKTDAAERNILKAAQRRLQEVNASLERLHSGIEGAPDRSQERYLDLVREQGQLHIIIARAQGQIA